MPQRTKGAEIFVPLVFFDVSVPLNKWAYRFLTHFHFAFVLIF